MGLDCSHNAFSGAYSAFDRLRESVVIATGGSWPPHEDTNLDNNFGYLGKEYTQENFPGMYIFLEHSDRGEEISPEDCRLIAHDLRLILPKVSEELGYGHLARQGGVKASLQQFIEGCELAARLNQTLEFR